MKEIRISPYLLNEYPMECAEFIIWNKAKELGFPVHNTIIPKPNMTKIVRWKQWEDINTDQIVIQWEEV